MGGPRGEFSSRFGFILAAAGSAVGLGNIWGFPTQAASNGGAAFLIIYLLLTFVLAYPALMAELIIGRYAKANAVTALRMISRHSISARIGAATGFAGILTASVILSFYAIIAGWMIAYFIAALAEIAGLDPLRAWLTEFGLSRNLSFTVVFMLFTVLIICGGVHDGIEKWSTRLMPALVVILAVLTVYVLMQPGAIEGLKAYLLPDFDTAIRPGLVVSAMGQAFFSLSLGVGGMLIYGSYIGKSDNLASLGISVTLLDVGIAVMAGLLILPAMYVAQHQGVTIFDANGVLIAGDRLIFTVLPTLFGTMGVIGTVVAFAFFALLTIASLTSSIAMLEVPVAYTIENHGIDRVRATFVIGGLITLASIVIILNFDVLFGLAVTLATRYGQPLLGFMFCVFAGWIWHRQHVLEEIRQGFPEVEQSLFWKIWPSYVRYVCPAAILTVFVQQLLT